MFSDGAGGSPHLASPPSSDWESFSMSSMATACSHIASEGEGYLKIAKTKALDLKCAAVARLRGVRAKTADVISNRAVQVTAASAVGGAVLAGGASGLLGLALGTAGGASVGVVPPIFTFGLSIPLFAAVGGGLGLAVALPAGGAAGAVGGGATGYAAYSKRAEITSFTGQGYAKARSTAQSAWARVASKSEAAVKFAEAKRESAKALARSSIDTTRQKVGEGCECASKSLAAARAKGIELASDRSVQVGAVSAAGSAAVCGTAGGVAGLCTGTVVGGAIYRPAAVSTGPAPVPPDRRGPRRRLRPARRRGRGRRRGPRGRRRRGVHRALEARGHRREGQGHHLEGERRSGVHEGQGLHLRGVRAGEGRGRHRRHGLRPREGALEASGLGGAWSPSLRLPAWSISVSLRFISESAPLRLSLPFGLFILRGRDQFEAGCAGVPEGSADGRGPAS
ncbi:unnamed protein product [Prorocentrum cordatum]|uniref:Uncharacterized protein n=1 Tax=Prorocentrum cordatum TaxID=2364126 RepID=A0ABN9WYJ9_9DINO|nr:unnamed protein product [Polarella glacialis]